MTEPLPADPRLGLLGEGLAPQVLTATLSAIADGPELGSQTEAVLQQLDDGVTLPRRLAGLAPVLDWAAQRGGAAGARPGSRLLAALALRETERSRIVAEQATEVEGVLTAAGHRFCRIRGPNFGRRYYPAPEMRHSHEIVLHLHCATLQEAARQIADAWDYAPRGPQTSQRLGLAGHQRVAVEFRRAALPFEKTEPGWQIDSPEAEATELLAHALVSPRRGSGRWMVDLAFLARHRLPDPQDWAEKIANQGFANLGAEILGIWAAALPHDSPMSASARQTQQILADRASLGPDQDDVLREVRRARQVDRQRLGPLAHRFAALRARLR